MKRTISIVLCAFILMAATIPASALTLPYGGSDSYKSGKYYNNYSELDASSNEIVNVLSTALSQVGYHGGNSLDEMHGTNMNSNGKFTEYSNYYSTDFPHNFRNFRENNYNWCAVFVNWVFCAAGVDFERVYGECGCWEWLNWYQQGGNGNTAWHNPATDEYAPQSGDIIFFDYEHEGVTHHIGIVLYADDNLVYTIEGNSGNIALVKSYPLSYDGIVAYCKPDYNVTTDEANQLMLDNGKKLGVYIVSNAASVAHIYENDSFSSNEIGSLTVGDTAEVKAIHGRFGKIDYNGTQAWVSLRNMRLLSTVGYTTNEGDVISTTSDTTGPATVTVDVKGESLQNIRFNNDDILKFFAGANDTTVALKNDETEGSVVSLTASKNSQDPYVSLNLSTLAHSKYSSTIDANKYRYVLIKAKVQSSANHNFQLFYQSKGGNMAANEQSSQTLTMENNGEWGYLLFDLSEAVWDGEAQSFRFDYLPTATLGDSVEIASITFLTNEGEANLIMEGRPVGYVEGNGDETTAPTDTTSASNDGSDETVKTSDTTFIIIIASAVIILVAAASAFVIHKRRKQ